jgi:hypothetical protein
LTKYCGYEIVEKERARLGVDEINGAQVNRLFELIHRTIKPITLIQMNQTELEDFARRNESSWY